MNTDLTIRDQKMLDVISKWDRPPQWKKGIAMISLFSGILLLCIVVLKYVLTPESSHTFYLLLAIVFWMKYFIQKQEYEYQRIIWMLMRTKAGIKTQNERSSIFMH